jgi:beta-1,2-mannobiose phosphorylase / 1,2-beta-oligomannan phosphorylase
MGIYRAPENPVIRPEQVRPSREDFEVIGVFNAGVARFGDEIILLLRVAERPRVQRENVVLSPIYDVDSDSILLKPFARDDPGNDFSDPRLIVRTAFPVSRASCPRVSKASRLRVAGETPATGRGQDALDTQGRDALATTETYLTSISHLRLARSWDGVRFQIADAPALGPANRYETFGIEDPRITCIDGTGSPTRDSALGGPTYYVAYVGVSPLGVTTCLASTRDFQSFERHGVIFPPDNKDVVIFPAQIGGKFYALHRPHSSLFLRNDIWLAESPDLLCWGRHRHLMATRDGRWDETRIGAGAVPFHTEKGWLEFYHGADRNNHYCMGAVLLDSAQTWEILARSRSPVFEPQADYERAGFFGNVVFSCGLLFEDETLKIYYGAADTSICYAEIPLVDVYRNLGL